MLDTWDMGTKEEVVKIGNVEVRTVTCMQRDWESRLECHGIAKKDTMRLFDAFRLNAQTAPKAAHEAQDVRSSGQVPVLLMLNGAGCLPCNDRLVRNQLCWWDHALKKECKEAHKQVLHTHQAASS
eukprot:906856-Pelagomonas_calceolata.AAC.4